MHRAILLLGPLVLCLQTQAAVLHTLDTTPHAHVQLDYPAIAPAAMSNVEPPPETARLTLSRHHGLDGNVHPAWGPDMDIRIDMASSLIPAPGMLTAPAVTPLPSTLLCVTIGVLLITSGRPIRDGNAATRASGQESGRSSRIRKIPLTILPSFDFPYGKLAFT